MQRRGNREKSSNKDPEVLRKTRSRLTLKFHQRRVAGLKEREIPPQADLQRILEIEQETAMAMRQAGSFHQFMEQVKVWQEQNSRKGGAAFLELLYALVRLTRP